MAEELGVCKTTADDNMTAAVANNPLSWKLVETKSLEHQIDIILLINNIENATTKLQKLQLEYCRAIMYARLHVFDSNSFNEVNYV